MRLRAISLLAVSTILAVALTGCLAVPGLVVAGASRTPAPSVAPADAQLPLFTSAASAPVTVEIYSDLGCPPCKSFMETNDDFLEAQADAGLASTTMVAVSITDSRFGTDEYATRAANAVDCVASLDPDSTAEAVRALYEAQPAEGAAGLTDAELGALTAGVSDAGEPLASCIRDRSAAAFVKATTDSALAGPLSDSVGALVGTPTVLVNGEQFEGATDDAAAFEAFVASAG